ncbi:hypothetical protein BJ170DRAFT_424135 [Xylariales sp. AK1849]|nr:hypothetical protein BJ170DRAFT_424135 [Xylariales sp. AK1849]
MLVICYQTAFRQKEILPFVLPVNISSKSACLQRAFSPQQINSTPADASNRFLKPLKDKKKPLPEKFNVEIFLNLVSCSFSNHKFSTGKQSHVSGQLRQALTHLPAQYSLLPAVLVLSYHHSSSQQENTNQQQATANAMPFPHPDGIEMDDGDEIPQVTSDIMGIGVPFEKSFNEDDDQVIPPNAVMDDSDDDDLYEEFDAVEEPPKARGKSKQVKANFPAKSSPNAPKKGHKKPTVVRMIEEDESDNDDNDEDEPPHILDLKSTAFKALKAAPKKRGRPSKAAIADAQNDQKQSQKKKKRGHNAAKISQDDAEDDQEQPRKEKRGRIAVQINQSDGEDEHVEPVRKGRGRPAKSDKKATPTSSGAKTTSPDSPPLRKVHGATGKVSTTGTSGRPSRAAAESAKTSIADQIWKEATFHS